MKPAISPSRVSPSFHDEARHWPLRESSRMVRVGRIDWHVQELGRAEAPVAILVHGTGAATHSFRGLLPLLAQDHRVIAMDLPGHGFTRGAQAEDLTLPGMARALGGLVAALGIDPALAIGHSAGVAVLLQTTLSGGIRPQVIIGFNAALEPIRGNALLSPLAKLLFANPLTARLVSFQARIGNMADHLLKATGTRIDQTGRDCYNVLLRQPAHINGALGMMANWRLEPLIANLGHLQTPVTLIAAADDPMVPARVSRQAATLIPDCTVEIVDHGGHLMHEADPALAAELIRRARRAYTERSTAPRMGGLR
ncbi:MAG: alpha/beta fold hydrolase [Hoeflea sp.]|uniref:alpha/beta fold hydrolase BchO n=1 Tax=Hoeflea sp. TaxID=1940281 RepID=UPI002731EE95|nr:alpha/beta fold hydrolase BchO [Hoeflea sp.]MDP2121074.1 alpha/beta fold hydrolase [Hoeflea sp.]MDP3524595.1 alpha/beta fold hydrolase [Hoeflea sp.]